PDGERFDDRCPEPEQRLVGIRLRGPLVDQLREIADVAERVAVHRGERRPQRLDVMKAHQIAPLPFEVADASVRERLEARTKPTPALPGILRHAALLAP